MGTLDKKLFRDLVRVWGQAIAIALVFGAGVATLVLASGAYKSLQETQTAYYERYRFANIFATARRVPAHVADRIALIPGVLAAQKRIQSTALLDIKGMSQPATGLIISLPRFGQPLVNTLYLREGRLPDPLHDVEIVVNESFAKAHALRPGSKLTAILNGRKKSLRIVGVALSPEFVYALGPGDFVPDNRRFAIIWMGETAAEAAFDLKGAFNSVAIKLMRNVRPERVLDQLDGLLADYGGRGGYLRKDQQSHAFIDAELQQLRAMSRVVPPIFLAVAAFMINTTLARLVAMERQQIGLLKALGYSNFSVALHYLKFVSVIAVLGIAIGMVAGVWLGRGLTRLYGEFYHFPFLVFTNSSDVFVIAGVVGIVSAWFGAGQAIVSVLALLPAAAMSPPRPTLYRRSLGKHAGWTAGMSQLSMMIVRHLIRFPIRASLTILGISASGHCSSCRFRQSIPLRR